MAKKSTWGGRRHPGPGKTLGPDPLPPNEKRKRVIFVLNPQTKPLAIKIARLTGLKASGYLIDQLVRQRALELGIEIE